MTKIRFNIEDFKTGNYSVETGDGKPARVLCTDLKGIKPIVAAVYYKDIKEEQVERFYENGRFLRTRFDDNWDLYLVKKSEK